MNKKEVKQLTKGCTVLVKATVESVQETKAYVHHGCITHPLPFSEIYSVPTQPKYDPCREFQPGDKVRMVMRDGRHPYCIQMREHIVPTDTICTVVRCECNGFVAVEYNNGYNPVVHFSFLELVTPVEELEPYSVTSDVGGHYVCDKEGMVISLYYNNSHPHAKEAAEDECDRLNAEWRKEQK
jgi:hypothetical protein